MAEPARLAFEHQLGSPRVGLVRILWATEAVDVGAVLRDEDEVAEVPLDEARLIFGPDRIGERLYLGLCRPGLGELEERGLGICGRFGADGALRAGDATFQCGLT